MSTNLRPDSPDLFTWRRSAAFERDARRALTDAISQDDSTTIDADPLSIREINRAIRQAFESGQRKVCIINPRARHNLGIGLPEGTILEIAGSAGYYPAGMNDGAAVFIEGGAGWGAAESMRDGTVVIAGNAGNAAAASIRSGTVVVKGEASTRAGVGMKGGSLIVAGNAGQGAGFMMQKGVIVICGNADDGVADSMYAGIVYVGGSTGGSAPTWWRPTSNPKTERPSSVSLTIGRSKRQPAVHFESSFPDASFGTSNNRISSSGNKHFERLASHIMNEPYKQSSNNTPASSYGDPSPMQRSGTFDPGVIEDIQIKAELARYRIRGFGALRERTWATFDDLTFIPAGLTRIPLEGYREKCSTKTVLGSRFAERPIELDIPLMVTGMSFGALSRNAKTALARGARMAGTSTTTGDGGMLEVERQESKVLIYEVLPSRYGINIQDLRRADAIELTIGQGQSQARVDCCWARRSPPRSPRFATFRPASINARLAAIPISWVPTTWWSRSKSFARRLTGRRRSLSKWARLASSTTFAWLPRPGRT